MSNVVNLHLEPEDGEPTFMLCPCKEEGVPFVVCVEKATIPTIMCLVCPECEQSVPVTEGLVGWVGE